MGCTHSGKTKINNLVKVCSDINTGTPMQEAIVALKRKTHHLITIQNNQFLLKRKLKSDSQLRSATN